jgi:hypothetical protein
MSLVSVNSDSDFALLPRIDLGLAREHSSQPGVTKILLRWLR